MEHAELSDLAQKLHWLYRPKGTGLWIELTDDERLGWMRMARLVGGLLDAVKVAAHPGTSQELPQDVALDAEEEFERVLAEALKGGKR